MANAIKQTNTLDSKLSKVGNVIAGAFAVNKIANFGSAIIDSLSKYEMFMASIKAMLGGNKGAAEALNSQLVNLAKTTPFSLEDVQSGSKQLLAYGFSVGNVTKDLKTLGDVSSGVGAPLNDIVYLYGTLRTQGRAFTKDINQFTGRGIPIIKELAKQFKVTDAAVMDLVKDGKIGFEQIEKAFKSMTSEGGLFFNMMDEQSKTVGGKISNMGDAWEQLKISIGKSQTGIIASTLDFTNKFLDNLNRGIGAKNLIEESFKKSGTKDFSFMETTFQQFGEKFGGLFGGKPAEGGYTELQQYADAMMKSKVSSSTDVYKAIENKKSLSYIISNIRGDRTIDDLYKERHISVLQTLIGKNQDIIDMYLKPKDGSGNSSGVGSPKSGSDIASGIQESVQRPQNLYINIDKLIEKQIIETNTLDESLPEIKMKVSQVLLEVVNDINNLSR
jgi:hypothetical protein